MSTLFRPAALLWVMTLVACVGGEPNTSPTTLGGLSDGDLAEVDLPLLEPGDWAEFDGGVNPFAPPDLITERSAQGYTTGSRTLKGATSSPPGAIDPPFTVSHATNASEVVIVQAKANAIPTANNSPRARFLSNITSYGYLQIPTTDAWQLIPFHMTQAQTFQLKLFNSATDTGPRYSQAVRWDYSIRSLPLNDGLEPNDDENPSTITDRTMAEPVPLSRQINRSMYQLIGASGSDREEWYSFSFTGGNTYRFIFGTTNGDQRRWTYSFRLYNSSEGLVASFLNYSGINTGWDVTPPTSGTHYLQVVGVPQTTRGASLYYAQYALKCYRLNTPVTVTNISPLVGQTGTPVTFSPVYTGDDTGYTWEWDFGGAADQDGSEEKNPTVTLQDPSPNYFVQVTARHPSGNQSGGNFRFEVTEGPPPPPDILDVQPRAGVSGESYQPDVTFAGDDTSWSWNFGGGAIPNTSTAQNPSVTLGAPENYSAHVTVTGPEGGDTFPYTLTVTTATGGVPATVNSPVFGSFTASTGFVNNVWSFWRNGRTGNPAHCDFPGILGSNDCEAYDLNLNVNAHPACSNLDVGMEFFPAAAGQVVYRTAGSTCALILAHPSLANATWWSGYVHASSLNVQVGDMVSASTSLGRIGRTSCGFPISNDHLHFSVYDGTKTSSTQYPGVTNLVAVNRDNGFRQNQVTITFADPCPVPLPVATNRLLSATATRLHSSGVSLPTVNLNAPAVFNNTCWSSSHPNIVSVDGNGVLSALSPGCATISLHYSGERKDIKVKVGGATCNC